MLIYFAAFAVAAVVLLWNNPRSATNRWASIFLLCAGIGGLSIYLQDANESATDVWLNPIAILLAFMNQVLTPYALVMFAIAYSDCIRERRLRRWISVLLLLPVLYMTVTTPLMPTMKLDQLALLLWAGPYYIGACALFIYAYVKETNRVRRQNRLVTALIIVPTILSALVFIYIARVFDPSFDFFRFVSFFIVYSFLIGIIFTFANGTLGVKLRFEKDRFDTAMKAVSSGTAILNHTIKNEVAKISMSAEAIESMPAARDADVQDHLRIIAHSTAHLQAMVSRIQSQMQDIVLMEEQYSLTTLINESIAHVRPLLDKGEVQVVIAEDWPKDVSLICDRIHLKEVLVNVLKNAVEAMPNGGKLHIAFTKRKRHAVVHIRDTGIGMSRTDMRMMFEPFYTTKHRGLNFGLGLSYCYHVVEKSGGTIEADSEIGKGTTLSIVWPRKKVRYTR